MLLTEAKDLLNGCVREELRDHAFGDAEVYWAKDGVEVASGYFGRDYESVGGLGWRFTGREAHELRRCGTMGTIERNDSTGPDTYDEGTGAPGLTLEGVKDELTRR